MSDSRAPRHSALEISAAEAKAIDRLVLIRSFRCSRAMLVDGFCLHKKWPLSTLTTRAAAAAALAAAAAAQPASSDRTTRRPSSNFLLRWWCSRSSGRGFLSQGMSPSPRPRPLAPRLISPLSMSPPLALLLLPHLHLHLPSASPAAAAAAAGARLALLRSSAGLRVWNCCDFHGT